MTPMFIVFLCHFVAKKNKKNCLHALSWKNLHISELPRKRLLGFQGKRDRDLGFEKANFWILAPYLARMCIFRIQHLLQLYMVLWSTTKMDFFLISAQDLGQPKRVIFHDVADRGRDIFPHHSKFMWLIWEKLHIIHGCSFLIFLFDFFG
jgi:hypothetical protein